MNIENQVTNKELSIQLEKAGYPQDKYTFIWNYYKDQKPVVMFCAEGNKTNTDVVAPTVAELGEALPTAFRVPFSIHWAGLKMYGKEDDWTVSYYDTTNKHIHSEYADTEANARAKMWLYLKKNNIIRG